MFAPAGNALPTLCHMSAFARKIRGISPRTETAKAAKPPE